MHLMLHICMANPPTSKRAAKSDNWLDARNRIRDALVGAGLSPPFRGEVHLNLKIEDKPGRDLDNRLNGIFAMLDLHANPTGVIFDDSQITRVVLERRAWLRDEPFTHVRAEMIS